MLISFSVRSELIGDGRMGHGWKENAVERAVR